MKLSDSFQAPPKENSLELVVKFVNLNYNVNSEDNEILQRSPSLLGYSKLLYYIKTAAKENGGDLKSAIDTSVKQCMEEGLIEDFLRKHSREVTGMLFNEITVEEFAEIRAREAYEDGEKSGFTKGEKSGFTKGEKSGLHQRRNCWTCERRGAETTRDRAKPHAAWLRPCTDSPSNRTDSGGNRKAIACML